MKNYKTIPIHPAYEVSECGTSVRRISNQKEVAINDQYKYTNTDMNPSYQKLQKDIKETIDNLGVSDSEKKELEISILGNPKIKSKTGYKYVTLYYGENDTVTLPVRIPVHRLVAKTFLPPPASEKHVWVNHKDGNKENNHVSNLEWTTISENIQHKYDTGLYKSPTGKDHWMYGRKVCDDTKKKMSEKKLGENHPKFKGWFVVNGIQYGSAIQAAKANNTDPNTIRRRCASDKHPEYMFVPKK